MNILHEKDGDTGVVHFSVNGHFGRRPLITLALPAYNEASILEQNLQILATYMQLLESRFDWEIVIINDGSSDNTGAIAELFARSHPKVRVCHHQKNSGLGKALQTAFQFSQGDYIVTMDIDLSYSPDHIERLLSKIIETKAKIVVASPTMSGGKISNVPSYRRFLSICANRFLSFISPSKLTNLTSMTRAYDGKFIRSLNLRSMGMEIMPEILYKTMIMHERIEEVPGHLKWNVRDKENKIISRRSSMRIFKHTLATIFTGFLLRPFLFFILPGFLLFLFSLYPITWLMIHFFNAYGEIAVGSFSDRASNALEIAYKLHPHTFLIGFLSLLLAIQLIALGFQSLQNKHYFEEIYNFMTKINRSRRNNQEEQD